MLGDTVSESEWHSTTAESVSETGKLLASWKLKGNTCKAGADGEGPLQGGQSVPPSGGNAICSPIPGIEMMTVEARVLCRTAPGCTVGRCHLLSLCSKCHSPHRLPPVTVVTEWFLFHANPILFFLSTFTLSFMNVLHDHSFEILVCSLYQVSLWDLVTGGADISCVVRLFFGLPAYK